MKEAFDAGNIPLYKMLGKESAQVNRLIRKTALELNDVSKTLNNLSGSSLKDLRIALASVYQKMGSGMIKRNSAEWKEMAKNARLLTAEIKGVENELRMTQSRFSGFTAGFNKYFAMGATVLAGITGFYLGW